MCFFQSPLFLPFLLLIAISPFVAWFLYRTVARLILRRVGTYWNVRRAIDVSFVGLITLSCASFYHDLRHDWRAHNSPEERATGDMIYRLRDVTYQTRSRYYAASEKLYQQYEDLSSLQDWQFLLDNFGNYVVLPACAMVFIGYAVQRFRKEKGRQSEIQRG
jgi:hypothetical protein